MRTKSITFPFAVCVLIYAAATSSSTYFFKDTWFRTVGPGGDPPWYFIGRDLVDATFAVPGLLVMVAFSSLTFRRLGPDVWKALGMLSIFLLHPILLGVNILLHTRDAWDPARATSEWASYEMYSVSKYQTLLVMLVITLLALGAFRYFKGKSEPSAPAV
jgi:hypothetical protein